MNTRNHGRALEIFSGSLLEKRCLWQRMMRKLPANSCLLILQPRNKVQEQIVKRIERAFQAQGRLMFVLKVD